MENKTYVIGDIHNAYRAFKQVLKRSPYKKGDTLILLGDYVDGWSEGAQLVQFLIEMKEDGHNLICIQGNHDTWTYEWLQFGHSDGIWLQQGGQATYESYLKTGYFYGIEGEKHKKFFRELHHYFLDDENRLFLHAGFTSHKGVEKEIHRPNFWWDRTLWESAVGAKRVTDPLHIPKRFKNYNEIYIGHTATVNWDYKQGWDENGELGTPIVTPMNSQNVWNLDTGCGFRGKLTIMDIDSKEYWQSDLVKKLYPDHDGRGEFNRNWKKKK